ncbi:MAG: PorT family protein [Flavobacteriaceae bacterium]|nr:PorT family protein [Flavobacteriaceae bacterium]
MKELKSIFLCFVCLGYFHFSNAQKTETVVDSLYLEDQLYLSAGYTFLTNRTPEVSQTGFSGEISTGFIKDIPLNKKRNFALGIGAGYAYNIYSSNLKINDNSVEIATVYDKNKLYSHWLEIPLEIRFRNSTPTRFSFYRFYAGLKFSYLFYSKSSFQDEKVVVSLKNNLQIDKFQYGLYFATGYSTFNLYVLYHLKPLFKKTNQSNASQLTVGLKFYIF